MTDTSAVLPNLFPPALSLKGDNILPSVKNYLKDGEEFLRLKHLEGESGHNIVAGFTLLIDTLLKTLWQFIETEIEKKSSHKNLCTLIALGGYGRGELNIRSDIDLMLLYPKKLLPPIEKLAQRLLYCLWDTGLDTGFSVRSLKECINLAKQDIKTKTAVLDARYIIGNTALFDEFLERLKADVFNEKGTAAFIKEKTEESSLRRTRYGGSVYLLEPNVKEGEGGLRDMHTALWLAKVKQGILDIEGLKNCGTLSVQEFKQLEGAIDFLWRVRNELHFESKRKLDQLTFDHQIRIALVFGFRNSRESLAVEKFMQRYYLHASQIFHISSLIASRVLHKYSTDISGYVCEMEKGIDNDFRLCSNLLCVTNADLFQEKPYKILKAFELTCLYNTNMDNTTKELLIKNMNLIDNSLIARLESRESFINILKSGRAYNTLEEMHRLRILGKLIPAFEEITCKVQHDMYHMYTIDAHSLFAVRELERLRGAGYKMEFFLLATIFEEVGRPELLPLAVLLHDIGKAKGRGHAEKGAEMIEGILEPMGFAEEDIELVRFLVRHHLILPDTAQGRDIHDEKLVINFAKTVGSIERLNLLYLLTFADIRAVGPEVWNQWKAALFQELYFKALIVLERGEFEPIDAVRRIPKIMAEVSGILKGEIFEDAIKNYFSLLPQRYFLSNSPQIIANHIRTVEGLRNHLFTMNLRHNKERNYTDVTICTLDMHGLFSKITGVMAANNINILGAQINTLKNGIALDVLQVASPTGEIILDEAKWKKVEKDLTDVLTGAIYVETLLSKRGESLLDKRPKPVVSALVEVDNEVSDEFTVIDIHAQDRVGLLYSITSSLAKLGLYIYVSKITTKGSEAADIFYVKDIFGQKVYYEKRLKEIQETILKAI